jgi:hypothetical protein
MYLKLLNTYIVTKAFRLMKIIVFAGAVAMFALPLRSKLVMW